MKKFILSLCAMCFIFLTGCAVTLPTSAYVPQNIVRTTGTTDVGGFTYAPFEQGTVKQANQIQNTAGGSIFVSMDVAEYVRRGTALELEKSGITLNDTGNYVLSGEVLEFKADDLGYSVHWIYSIRYIITDKRNSAIVHDKTYTPEMKKTGKFGLPMDYANTASEMILSGYNLFIRDPAVRSIISQPLPPILN